MATMPSFCSPFFSLFIVLLHLGCFLFPAISKRPKKRKASSSSSQSKLRAAKALSFVNPWPYLKPIFSSKTPNTISPETRHLQSTASASLAESSPNLIAFPTPKHKRSSGSFSGSDFAVEEAPRRPSFTFRNDIFACHACGEVFHAVAALEHHQSTKHAVSELCDGDSAKNIVNIIFQTGWSDGNRNRSPHVHRILKIHNSPKILSRFEDYREAIKGKSAKIGGRWSERCIADGNEVLRFHCSTFLCSLGQDGGTGLCGQEFCSVCGIVRSGFSPKLDGISMMASSRAAHEAIPGELEEEFGFMNVKRAMLVCRVVAGRVERDEEETGKGEGKFDSAVVSSGSHTGGMEEELLVFNPRAVLPCFVIVYNVV